MKFVLPRVILGNRGDLASRWGVLHALHSLGEKDVTVFRRGTGDVPDLPYRYLDYRPYRNLFQDAPGKKVLREADTVLWSVGLDMQDDSSLAKLMYLWVAFSFYRRMGLRTWILFQGAGPITTRTGKWLARQVLHQVDVFVARDPGTYDLAGRLSPGLNCILAHDAIFLPGFQEGAKGVTINERDWLAGLFNSDNRPVIGLNVRQWFHFSSSLLPYQFARKTYLKRSETQMENVITSVVNLVGLLRKHLDARILLISAYQPGVVPWEDDQPWLERIKARFEAEPEVMLTNYPLSMPGYYALMSRMNMVIGMRLHSSLIALRYGVPAINLSYTLKGGDIMRHLGLSENVMDLPGFLEAPQNVFERAASILNDFPGEREATKRAVQKAVLTNMTVLRSLLG